MYFQTIPLSLTMFQVRFGFYLICMQLKAIIIVDSFINSKPDKLWINTDFSHSNTEDEDEDEDDDDNDEKDQEEEDLFTEVAVSKN